MSYNPYSLEGKTVLVTGASSGIGQATAIECSRLGATVVITGRNQERLEETFRRLEDSTCGHRMIIADITNSDDTARLVDEIGPLNGVVLCAGKGLTVPFTLCDRKRYDSIFNTNFFATVELLRLTMKKKKILDGSSIVFVASVGGVTKFSVGSSVYGASKAALTSTMKFCAKEFAPRKIRVNSVNPGMVNTPLINPSVLSEKQLAVYVENYPLKRFGEPIEIAHAIIYLLSDAAAWITGVPLIVDGGDSI